MKRRILLTTTAAILALSAGGAFAGNTFNSGSIGEWMKGKEFSASQRGVVAVASEEALLAKAAAFRASALSDLRKAVDGSGADRAAFGAYVDSTELTYLFAGSIIFAGNISGPAPITAFYNPYIDASALVLWKGSKEGPVPAVMTVVTGSALTGGDGAAAPWLAGGTARVEGLMAQYGAFSSAFARRFPYYSTTPAFVAPNEAQGELSAVTARIKSASVGLERAIALTGRAEVADLLKGLARAVSSSDLKAYDAISGGFGNILNSRDVNAIPMEVKKGFMPVFAVDNGATTTAFIQVVGNPRFVVPLELSKEGSPAVGPAALYDIEAPRGRR